MATENINDHKFGLPKPDFHEIPIKGTTQKPLFLIILGAVAAISLLFYYFFYRTTAPPKATSSLPPETVTAVDPPVNIEVNEAVSGKEAFESTKQITKKEDIHTVQKKLEAQGKLKPFVKPGTYQELHAPQGIYHLVVVSSLDKKIAMQSVQQLIRKNVGVCLLLPHAGEKYYRVTIGHSRTQYEAEQKLKEFQSKYDNLFILKY